MVLAKRGVLTPVQAGLLSGGGAVLAALLPNVSVLDGVFVGALVGVPTFLTTRKVRAAEALEDHNRSRRRSAGSPCDSDGEDSWSAANPAALAVARFEIIVETHPWTGSMTHDLERACPIECADRGRSEVRLAGDVRIGSDDSASQLEHLSQHGVGLGVGRKVV